MSLKILMLWQKLLCSSYLSSSATHISMCLLLKHWDTSQKYQQRASEASSTSYQYKLLKLCFSCLHFIMQLSI